jgi:plastocyanin
MIASRFLRTTLVAAFAALFGTAAAAKVVHIDIKTFSFTPKRVTAEIGDTIEWTNRDSVGHTVSADDKSFEVVLSPGATERLLIEHAGKFYYYCHFHSSMTARVEIVAP